MSTDPHPPAEPDPVPPDAPTADPPAGDHVPDAAEMVNAETPPEPTPETPGPDGPPAPADIDPASPEGLALYDAETVRLVSAEEAHVSELESSFDDAHAIAASRKKAFEAARDELLALIRRRRDNRGKKPEKPAPTLFDGVKDDAPAADGPPADLWKEFPLADARWLGWGLTAKDVEKLAAGEIKSDPGRPFPVTTFGDVSRFIQPDQASSYVRRLSDLKGFGESAVERWQKAEEQFWAWWRGGGEAEFAAAKGYGTAATTETTEDTTPAAEVASLVGWRALPIEDLDTTRAADAKLVTAGVRTLGELAAKLAAGETFGLPEFDLDRLREQIDAAGADDPTHSPLIVGPAESESVADPEPEPAPAKKKRAKKQPA